MNMSEEELSGCFHSFLRQDVSSIYLFQLVINGQKENMSGSAKELERIKTLKILPCSREFSPSRSENYKITLLLLKCVTALSNRDEMYFTLQCIPR